MSGAGCSELRLGKPAKVAIAPSDGSAGDAGLKVNFVKNNLTAIIIWVVVIGAAFAYAWWKGYLLRLSNYVALTREELRKCTWPTWEELKGSTVVVTISIALLGIFCYVVDTVFYYLVRLISA